MPLTANMARELRFSPLFTVTRMIRHRRELRRWQRGDRSGAAPHLLKRQILLEHAQEYGLRILVETGTYLGDMVNAMRFGFDHVFSIELDSTLYQHAKRRFKQAMNVSLLEGDSSVVLPTVLAKLCEPALFWLDAHYSGGITAGGKISTPIVNELRAILDRNEPRDVILIDDAREFTGAETYPSFTAVESLIGKYQIRRRCAVAADVIRIIPEQR